MIIVLLFSGKLKEDTIIIISGVLKKTEPQKNYLPTAYLFLFVILKHASLSSRNHVTLSRKPRDVQGVH